MVIFSVYLIFLILGLALLFGGKIVENNYMMYSGAIFLMVIGTIGVLDQVQYQSGIVSVLSGATTTVTYQYVAINNWTFEAFNYVNFLLGFFGLLFPYISGSKTGDEPINKGTSETAS